MCCRWCRGSSGWIETVGAERSVHVSGKNNEATGVTVCKLASKSSTYCSLILITCSPTVKDTDKKKKKSTIINGVSVDAPTVPAKSDKHTTWKTLAACYMGFGKSLKAKSAGQKALIENLSYSEEIQTTMVNQQVIFNLNRSISFKTLSFSVDRIFSADSKNKQKTEPDLCVIPSVCVAANLEQACPPPPHCVCICLFCSAAPSPSTNLLFE